jgi:tetratricopeptide (TPR) repeat protein
VPLAELERRGVIRRTASGELRFGESLTQEVAYRGLLLRERRSLHGRAARLLEESGTAQKALIAHHWARSDERERGVELMLEAAQQAEDLPSYGDAIRLHHEAWGLAETALADRPEDERLQRFVLQAVQGVCRVSVLYGAPEGTEEHRAAHRGEELSEALGENESLAALYVLHGMLLVGGPREGYERAVALVEKALELAGSLGSDIMRATTLRGLSWAYLLDGRLEDAQRTIDDSLALLDRLGETPEESPVYQGTFFLKCQIAQWADDPVQAERLAEETRDLALRGQNRTIEGAASSILASLYFCRGEYEAAERLAREALSIGEDIGNLATVRNCTVILCAVACERGDRSVSAAELERLERGLLKPGNFSINLESIVAVLIELGKLESPHRIAEKAVARSGALLLRATNLLAFGSVCARLGASQWGAAGRALGEGLTLARRLHLRVPEARALLGLAELAAARGEPELARGHASAALEIFQALGFAHFARRAERVLESVGEAAP